MSQIAWKMVGYSLLAAASALATYGCAPRMNQDLVSASGSADDSGLTSIDVGLPDRSRLGVAGIENTMNAYHITVQPREANCPGATVVNRIGDYAPTASLGESLKQGCDYLIVLALGNKDATSTTALRATYFKNNTPAATGDIRGKPSIAVGIRLDLQDDGRAIGLVGAVAPQPVVQPTPVVQVPAPTPVPVPPPVSTFPADKDLTLTAAAGGQKKISEMFTGSYLILDFSQAFCGACKDMARRMGSDARLMQMLDGTKCSAATIVPLRELQEWAGMFPGTVASHTYAYTDQNAAAQKLFGERITSLPTVVMLDRQGQVVGKDMGQFPREFNSLCAP